MIRLILGLFLLTILVACAPTGSQQEIADDIKQVSNTFIGFGVICLIAILIRASYEAYSLIPNTSTNADPYILSALGIILIVYILILVANWIGSLVALLLK